MPELPEVEATRKLCARYLNGRRVQSVKVIADPIVFCGQTPSLLEAALLDRRVVECHRRGKYFWWELESHGALLLHLGMTGAVHVPDGPAQKLSHGIDFHQAQWPPRFTKFSLVLDNGQKLAFCDPRRFGRVQWQEDPISQPPVSKLGVDPVAQPLSWSEFEESLARRKGVIKGLLLNQSFIAGVGNWIADEVLYQAKLDPRSRVPELTGDQRRALYHALQDVLKHAVSVDADASRFPSDWLFHRRWGKKANATDSDGAAVEFVQIAGRTTAWVPKRQVHPRPTEQSRVQEDR